MSASIDRTVAAYGAVPVPGRPAATIRRACLLIPAAMLAISAATILLQHALRGRLDLPPDLDGVLFNSNLRTLRAIPHTLGTDSWQPMLAVRDWLALHPGQDAYGHFFFLLGMKFQYPLSSLLLVQWLPLHGTAAVAVLDAIGMAAWLAIVPGMALLALALARLLGVPLAASLEGPLGARGGAGASSARFWLVGAAAMATLCFYPMMRAVWLGQAQIVLDALFVYACYAMATGRSATAGVLIGLSALVKPQMALFLLWGLLRRDRPFLSNMAACLLLGYIASAALYGWAWPLGYLDVLAYIDRHGESLYANQSVNGLVNRLLDNGPNLAWDGRHFAPYHPLTSLLTLASTLALVIAGLWTAPGAALPRAASSPAASSPVASSPAPSSLASSSLAATASLMTAALAFTMASPVAWEHHYGIALPAFALLFLSALATPAAPRGIRRPLACAAFVLLANVVAPLNLLAATPLNILQSYQFLAALVLLALLVLHQRDPYRPRPARA